MEEENRQITERNMYFSPPSGESLKETHISSGGLCVSLSDLREWKREICSSFFPTTQPIAH